MIRIYWSIILAIWISVTSCALPQLFPTEVTDGVDQNFDFKAWRNMPNAKTGQKVQLGGRIVQTGPLDGSLVIIATQLPIIERPAYGPSDNHRRSGEFAILYPGVLDQRWLTPGNRLIVIGTTEQAKTVVVEDVKRGLPSLTAHCLRIWQTVGKEIADFPYNTGGGYEPLVQDTFCTSQ